MERSARGQSVPPSALRRFAKAPAAARFPAKTQREFPLSRPLSAGAMLKAPILFIVFLEVSHEPLREMYGSSCKKGTSSKRHVG